MNSILQNQVFINSLNHNNLVLSFNGINEKQTKTNYQRDNCLDIAQALEVLDDIFFKSKYRKDNYKVKQFRYRTIITTFGEIRFRRRQYQNKNYGQKYYYFTDEILKLDPYQRISDEVKKEILIRVTTDSYQRVANDLDISKTTVYSLLRSLRDKILVNPKVKKRKINYLYVQADECYVSLQRKLPDHERNKLVVEQITVHEGLEPVCKGRNRLINKTMYSRAHDESFKDFIERVNLHILQSYKYKHIYLYGDGANWIKGAAEGIGAIYITDLFHSYQAVNKLTTDKEMRKLLSQAVREDDFESFKAYKIQMIEKHNWTETRERNYSFLENQWTNIQRNYTHSKSVGCSQEGINSHYYARRLTTTPRGFHHATARLIAQLISIKNKVTDFNDYLEEYIKPDVKLEIKNEKKQKSVYVIQQGTIPSDSGTKEQRKFIRDLANPKLK